MILEGILSVLGAASSAFGLFSGINSLFRGRSTKQQLERLSNSVGGLELQVERLGDHILYVSNLPGVRDTAKSRQQHIDDLSAVREMLEPVQGALGDNILASAVIETPDKLASAMREDPFDVLLDPRPCDCPAAHPNLVPILFQDSGKSFIGWQSRSGLENMFDVGCNELWLPSRKIKAKPKLARKGGGEKRLDDTIIDNVIWDNVQE